MSFSDQIQAAIRNNEIGDADPYALAFAGTGHSGPSIGVFQADFTQREDARSALYAVCVTCGATSSYATRLVTALNVVCSQNPLSLSDAAFVENIFHSPTGRATVDKLDAASYATVQSSLSTLLAQAADVGLALDAGAQCAVACWINMTGYPGTMTSWLLGNLPQYPAPKPSGPIVGAEDIFEYLRYTKFFRANPRDFQHFQNSVNAAVKE